VSQQHLQGDGPNPPATAAWEPLERPADVHPAAFEAWMHTSRHAVLVMFWFCDAWKRWEQYDPGSWQYEVRIPGRLPKVVWVTGPQGPPDRLWPLDSAASYVKDLELKGAW